MLRFVVVALALLLPIQAASQDTSGFGFKLMADLFVTLDRGFGPEPHTVAVDAGGDLTVNQPPCTYGTVSSEPYNYSMFKYNYTGEATLYVHAEAEENIMLFVSVGSGGDRWYCDDDALGRTHPVVEVPLPQGETSEWVNVWVGTYDGSTVPATLYVSEVDPRSGSASSGSTPSSDGTPPPAPSPAPPPASAPATASSGDIRVGATPTYGNVDLTEGFRPDPYTKSLTAGGSVEVNHGGCTYGNVASSPDLDLDYTTSGGSSLYFYAEAENDVTLLVNLPDGSWVCDDDGLGDRNPVVAIPNAPAGHYDVWVGTYGDAMASATLSISEINPGGGGGSSSGQISIRADPTYGDVRMSQGSDSNLIDVMAGGALQPNFGACTYGNVAGAPDVNLYYEGDSTNRLGIAAVSAGDVMLLVNLPDGSWVCDDDSGEDRNAIVTVERAPAGLYNIWVGTYGSEMEEAQLFIADEDGLQERRGSGRSKGP